VDVDAYCLKSDGDILEDIVNNTVPRGVLVDKAGWKRVCQVRGRHFSHVDADAWRAFCALRGEAGPPPGPYR
jgi:hypothetical protein